MEVAVIRAPKHARNGSAPRAFGNVHSNRRVGCQVQTGEVFTFLGQTQVEKITPGKNGDRLSGMGSSCC